MKCPSCAQEIDEESVNCPSCGVAIFDEQTATTRLLPETPKPAPGGGSDSASGRKPSASSASRTLASSDSLDRARFVAGTMLEGRYRVVGLLGRGGMGEVYRAEDLKLEQPVALKFLPETLSADGAALARFHREVRVARQISHRNVCRVYDIGESEGLHFLSMEYVRGEELSSVIKRFGRLPSDKATEIARQLCAGLAAAHEAGVIHRDLKPSNVMIDENGNVRVTDFGLAGLSEEFSGGAALEGTPEYMSPEQLAGRELSARSDIYSLGLVLYEVFTGRKAFTANTLPELLRLRRTVSMPESPSTIVRDLDPLVERVIERCLAPDPKERPASALQVAAALPGGDPLAAALAAGETPSPEMVAAAPKEGSLRPPVALALLALALVGFGLSVLLSRGVFLHLYVPLEKSAQGLKERAGELSARLGYGTLVDAEHSFYADTEYLNHVRARDRSPKRWERLRAGQPAAVGFWYRQSPRYLVPLSRERVTDLDPPRTVSEMAGLSLDTRGRLLSFYGVPPQIVEPQEAPAPAFDWSLLFKEAGLDLSQFRETEPRWVPAQPFDARKAWEGFYPGQQDAPLRVEAASFRGRPVQFQLINPWSRPSRQEQEQAQAGEHAVQTLLITLFMLILLSAALLARHNLRLGRGDRKGAFRLAAFFFALAMFSSLISTHHVPTLAGEFALFVEALGFNLMATCLLWLVYIAVEPFVRRRWPGTIISWNRLLAGDWRDPLVGRDVLLGAVFGFALLLVGYLQIRAPEWLGLPASQPAAIELSGLLGARQLTTLFGAQVLNSLLAPAFVLLLLLLFNIILRKEWLAAGAVWVLFTLPGGLAAGENFALNLPLAATGAALMLFVLLRFGLLATFFSQFFIIMFNFFPITPDLSAWYAGGTIFCLFVGAALILFGFQTSLAGQPLFRGSLVDD
ncbi:MAG TPA: protein kinase [Pyrinomonadaceae bacterium]|nr:protein kinase [Pyrinomonadaceae bacterium]